MQFDTYIVGDHITLSFLLQKIAGFIICNQLYL